MCEFCESNKSKMLLSVFYHSCFEPLFEKDGVDEYEGTVVEHPVCLECYTAFLNIIEVNTELRIEKVENLV